MIHSITGILVVKNEKYIAIETTGGIGFKVFIAASLHKKLPGLGESVKVLCATAVTREGIDLYGFLTREELELFELFTSITGIGPKGALKIMGAGNPEEIKAAIYEGRTDLLIKAGGIGEKKASRIILEMRDKVKGMEGGILIGAMEINNEIEDALQELGFKKYAIKEALKKIPATLAKKEERMKEALKLLGRK